MQHPNFFGIKAEIRFLQINQEYDMDILTCVQ